MRKCFTYNTVTLKPRNTVAITHVCQLPYPKNLTRAWPTLASYPRTLEARLRARIYYQTNGNVATIEMMNEASERIKAYSCIGMAICYQYESAYFPAPYADN